MTLLRKNRLPALPAVPAPEHDLSRQKLIVYWCSILGKKARKKSATSVTLSELGYKDSNLEMTESESFIGEAGKPVFMRGSSLVFSKSFSTEY